MYFSFKLFNLAKPIAFFLFTALSFSANAAWLNTKGKITGITTYANTNTILVTLSVEGSAVEECTSKNTFAVSKNIGVEARSRMYAMLLARQAQGESVVVSYNEVGGCEPWGASPSVYRSIVRLR